MKTTQIPEFFKSKQEKNRKRKKVMNPKQNSEALSLEQEAKRLTFSREIRRAAEYYPSLDEIKSIPFCDYVRHTLLGVPKNDPPTNDNENRSNRLGTRSSARQAEKLKRKNINLSSSNHSYSSYTLNSNLKPCKRRLADGIAKVVLPEGWWNRKGIANDLTARGKMWQPGSKLGDTIISSSIKQCPSGIGGVYDFTLIELPPITVSEFRNKADKYRKHQIGQAIVEKKNDEDIDELARKFWRRLGPTMEPSVYGADVKGSFFDGAHASGWNIDKLDTCIQLLRADLKDGDKDETYSLPGVTSAYLYFGMWASVFAAHTEDMNLLSINYLHAGAPKYWYAISPDDSERFKSLAISHFGAAAAQCPEFLRHKRYLLSPAILRKAGISYTTQIQRPGDAIITFPGSYHFGFNTGFNVAESTNFAVQEWFPVGLTAKVCMCHPHSVRIDLKRFKQLLIDYENNKTGNQSFMEWAKAAVVQRKKLEQTQMHKISPSIRPNYKKGIVVQLSHLSRYKENANKRKSPGSHKKKKIKDQWRLALKVRQDVFIRNTSVLCVQNCENDEGKECEQYLSGKITEVVDNHVRVHFHGMLKDADVWISRDSESIFLDGGPEKPPETKTKPKNLFKKLKC